MEDTHLKAFCGYLILVACYVMKRKKIFLLPFLLYAPTMLYYATKYAIVVSEVAKCFRFIRL